MITDVLIVVHGNRGDTTNKRGRWYTECRGGCGPEKFIFYKSQAGGWDFKTTKG